MGSGAGNTVVGSPEERLIGWSLTRASVPTPYSAGVIAVNFEQAKTIAVVATTALVVGAVASFWVMKSLVQKLLVAGLLIALAFAVWTQRGQLQDCADKVQDNFTRSGTTVAVADTECSFFGVSITISDPRSE
jgi:hypothetical protein